MASYSEYIQAALRGGITWSSAHGHDSLQLDPTYPGDTVIPARIADRCVALSPKAARELMAELGLRADLIESEDSE